MRLTYERVRASLRSPFAASHGTVSERELLLIGLETDAGLKGYGEAAPLPSYDGVTVDDVTNALEAIRPIIDTAADFSPDLLVRCSELTTVAPALAAIDLALLDLEGRARNTPVWKLLGAQSVPPLRVNWTISSEDRRGAAAEAAAAREAGFQTIKAKVAIGDDHGRLAAIRALAGEDMHIRIDANGGWEPDEAEASLRLLEPVGIELCEQPVRDLAAIAALQPKTVIPLAIDESTGQPGALDARVCRLACLKVMRSGGIRGLVRDGQRARAGGYEIFLASTLDGPLGIAAALHAAAALGPMRPCGLATLAMVGDRPNPLPARDGTIAIPDGAGLGDGLLQWYRA
jgi:L-alanine-DL-glutamate epimerase-like enolase superfamily enzyme